MMFTVSDPARRQWRTEWRTTCFWQLMQVAVTAVVCVLWRPSKVSARYAYSEQLDGGLEAAGDPKLELSTKPMHHLDSEAVFSLEDEEEEKME